MEKLKVYTFWDFAEMPEYIKLCIKTMRRHLGKGFELLSKKRALEIAPELKTSHIWNAAHRKGPDYYKGLYPLWTDYIRFRILKRLSGIWIDADTIVLRPFNVLLNLLNYYQFIGRYANNGMVSVNMMGFSTNSNIPMKMCNAQDEKLENLLEPLSGSDLGARMLSPIVLNEMKERLYFLDLSEIAPIMFEQRQEFFDSSEDILEKHKSLKPFCYALYNKGFPDWFVRMSEEEILNGDILISSLFRRALGIKKESM